MAMFRKSNKKLRSDETTGFGTYSKDNSGRYYDKDGLPNVRKKGLNIFESLSWYHTMINLPSSHFLLLIFLFYIFINLIFTWIYALIGIEHLVGIKDGNTFEQFMELFFLHTDFYYCRVWPY